MATRWQDPLQRQPSACGLLSSGKEKQHWVIIIRQRTWNGKEFVSWMVDLSEFSSLLDMLSLWTCMSSYKGTTKGQHFLFKLFFFVLPENGILKRSPAYWLITEFLGWQRWSILNPPKNNCCINMSKKIKYDSVKINQWHIHKTWRRLLYKYKSLSRSKTCKQHNIQPSKWNQSSKKVACFHWHISFTQFWQEVKSSQPDLKGHNEWYFPLVST